MLDLPPQPGFQSPCFERFAFMSRSTVKSSSNNMRESIHHETCIWNMQYQSPIRMTLPIFRLGNFLQKSLQNLPWLHLGCFGGGGVDPSLLCLSTNPTNPPGVLQVGRRRFKPSIFWSTRTFVTENSSGVWKLVIPFTNFGDLRFFSVGAGHGSWQIVFFNPPLGDTGTPSP